MANAFQTIASEAVSGLQATRQQVPATQGFASARYNGPVAEYWVSLNATFKQVGVNETPMPVGLRSLGLDTDTQYTNNFSESLNKDYVESIKAKLLGLALDKRVALEPGEFIAVNINNNGAIKVVAPKNVVPAGAASFDVVYRRRPAVAMSSVAATSNEIDFSVLESAAASLTPVAQTQTVAQPVAEAAPAAATPTVA